MAPRLQKLKSLNTNSLITANISKLRQSARRYFLAKNIHKKIGEINVSKYLVKKDNSLLRLNEAKIIMCTLPDEEAKSRGCIERGECEELVLVYRPFGCIKEKDEVNLDEMTVVSSKASTS